MKITFTFIYTLVTVPGTSIKDIILFFCWQNYTKNYLEWFLSHVMESENA